MAGISSVESERSQTADGGADFGYTKGLPLVEPEVLRSEQGILEVELISEPVSIDVSGASVLGTVYNGAFVGPTLQLSPGESLHLSLGEPARVREPTSTTTACTSRRAATATTSSS